MSHHIVDVSPKRAAELSVQSRLTLLFTVFAFEATIALAFAVAAHAAVLARVLAWDKVCRGQQCQIRALVNALVFI